jgi:hypothetical protein
MNIEKMKERKAAVVRPDFYSLGSLLRLLFSWNKNRISSNLNFKLEGCCMNRCGNVSINPL